jgi:hypothetical protein
METWYDELRKAELFGGLAHQSIHVQFALRKFQFLTVLEHAWTMYVVPSGK